MNINPNNNSNKTKNNLTRKSVWKPSQTVNLTNGEPVNTENKTIHTNGAKKSYKKTIAGLAAASLASLGFATVSLHQLYRQARLQPALERAKTECRILEAAESLDILPRDPKTLSLYCDTKVPNLQREYEKARALSRDAGGAGLLSLSALGFLTATQGRKEKE
jgi:hypothetical protein